MSGVWEVNWQAFGALVPRRILDDDDARLELAEGLSICAAVVNNPKEALFPDQPEDE